MSDTNELQAAIERLRRVKAGEDVCKVYATDNYSLACNSEDNDRLTVSDAYLALGTRQPDEQRVFGCGFLWPRAWQLDVIREEIPDAKLMRVATFIQEIPEVPNAGT